MYDVEVPGLFPDDGFDGNFITNGDVFADEEISVLFVPKKEACIWAVVPSRSLAVKSPESSDSTRGKSLT